MKLGEFAEVTRAFGADDLKAYAELSAYAVQDKRVPEPLIGALFSYLLGVRLPGDGTMYLKQTTRFLYDAICGEPLTARVEITRLRPEKHLVDLYTVCRDEKDRIIAEGRALVYIGDVARERID